MSLYDKIVASERPSSDFGHILDELAIENRIPLSCVFELTPLCNFSCPFCYARKSKSELEARGESLLGFDKWRDFTDQLYQLGMLTLTLTGGECLMHPDFCQIYEHAYDLGISIIIMSNISLLTDEILNLFIRKPPMRIYITVYGASPDTYEKVCGNAAFYDTVHKNIERLVANKMQVVLQFTSSNDNVNDLLSVYEYAKSIDAPLRRSFILNNFGRCTTEIIDNVSADTDLYMNQAMQIWFDERGLTKEEYNNRPVTSMKINIPENPPEKGIPCNAGKDSCQINYRGEMLPCVSFDDFKFLIEGRSVADAWHELNEWADNVPRISECEKCIHTVKCGRQCLAMHYNDTKKLGVPSPRLCWKQLNPEKAKETEERYARDGYLRSDLDLNV